MEGLEVRLFPARPLIHHGRRVQATGRLGGSESHHRAQPHEVGQRRLRVLGGVAQEFRIDTGTARRGETDWHQHRHRHRGTHDQTQEAAIPLPGLHIVGAQRDQRRDKKKSRENAQKRGVGQRSPGPERPILLHQTHAHAHPEQPVKAQKRSANPVPAGREIGGKHEKSDRHSPPAKGPPHQQCHGGDQQRVDGVE